MIAVRGLPISRKRKGLVEEIVPMTKPWPQSIFMAVVIPWMMKSQTKFLIHFRDKNGMRMGKGCIEEWKAGQRACSGKKEREDEPKNNPPQSQSLKIK